MPDRALALEAETFTMRSRETLDQALGDRVRARVPNQLAFRKADGLPRTPTGEIHKPGLREQMAADRLTRRR